jgi:hypothetical protein
MSSIFDLVKLYASEWTEVNSRKFTPEECKAVQGCSVVASQYGKSVCFMFVNGKRYIPLEPTADVAIGDTLAVDKLEIVALKYSGTNTAQKVTDILRIRVTKDEAPAATFDNPFGL